MPVNLDYFKAAALSGVVLVCGASVILELQLSSSVKRADAVTLQARQTIAQTQVTVANAGLMMAQATTAIAHVSTAVDTLLGASTKAAGKVSTTLDRVNASCVPGPCGVLADTNKTLNTFRMTAGQAEIAFNHEDRNLTMMDAQEVALFVDLRDTIAAARPVEDGITKTTLDFDALLKDPAIPATMKNVSDITGTTGHMLVTADAVETKYTYSYLHPSHNPFVRFGQIAEPFLLPAAQVTAAGLTLLAK